MPRSRLWGDSCGHRRDTSAVGLSHATVEALGLSNVDAPHMQIAIRALVVGGFTEPHPSDRLTYRDAAALGFLCRLVDGVDTLPLVPAAADRHALVDGLVDPMNPDETSAVLDPLTDYALRLMKLFPELEPEPGTPLQEGVDTRNRELLRMIAEFVVMKIVQRICE